MKVISYFFLTVLCSSLLCCRSDERKLSEARALAYKQQYLGSNRLLDEVLLGDPSSVAAYLERAANYSMLGRHSKAMSDHEKVLSIDANNTMALFNIGNHYSMIEEYQKALVFYNRAFASKGGEQFYIDHTYQPLIDNPHYDVSGPEIFFERAKAYYFLDSLSNSYKDLKAALFKGYRVDECYLWLAQIYFDTGDKKQGCECLHRSKIKGNQEAVGHFDDLCKDFIPEAVLFEIP